MFCNSLWEFFGMEYEELRAKIQELSKYIAVFHANINKLVLSLQTGFLLSHMKTI